MITETEDIAHALTDAARRWPQDRGKPSKLLLDLVREGHRSITEKTGRLAEERSAAVQQTAGVLTGTYSAGYLADLRQDWPE